MARTLLTKLVDRGVDPTRPMLFGIDGSKALRKAIREVWGSAAVVQRCQVHKIRNVLDHLPEPARPRVRSQMRKAYEEANFSKAKAQLERLAQQLEREHPGAAASLREGLDETLTLQRLGIRGALFRTLQSTNTIENPQRHECLLHEKHEALARRLDDRTVDCRRPRSRAAPLPCDPGLQRVAQAQSRPQSRCCQPDGKWEKRKPRSSLVTRGAVTHTISTADGTTPHQGVDLVEDRHGTTRARQRAQSPSFFGVGRG